MEAESRRAQATRAAGERSSGGRGVRSAAQRARRTCGRSQAAGSPEPVSLPPIYCNCLIKDLRRRRLARPLARRFLRLCARPEQPRRPRHAPCSLRRPAAGGSREESPLNGASRDADLPSWPPGRRRSSGATFLASSDRSLLESRLKSGPLLRSSAVRGGPIRAARGQLAASLNFDDIRPTGANDGSSAWKCRSVGYRCKLRVACRCVRGYALSRCKTRLPLSR